MPEGFGGSSTLAIVVRTFLVSGTATVLATLVGVPVGYAIARGTFRGRTTLLGAINTGMGMPPVVVGVDGILDVVGPPDVMGRVGDTRVRVPLGAASVPPLLGAQVVVSTDRFAEVE